MSKGQGCHKKGMMTCSTLSHIVIAADPNGAYNLTGHGHNMQVHGKHAEDEVTQPAYNKWVYTSFNFTWETWKGEI